MSKWACTVQTCVAFKGHLYFRRWHCLLFPYSVSLSCGSLNCFHEFSQGFFASSLSLNSSPIFSNGTVLLRLFHYHYRPNISKNPYHHLTCFDPNILLFSNQFCKYVMYLFLPFRFNFESGCLPLIFYLSSYKSLCIVLSEYRFWSLQSSCMLWLEWSLIKFVNIFYFP